MPVGDSFRQSTGASLAECTGRVLDRYLNVLPTVTIREGYRIKVYLNLGLEPSPVRFGALKRLGTPWTVHHRDMVYGITSE